MLVPIAPDTPALSDSEKHSLDKAQRLYEKYVSPTEIYRKTGLVVDPFGVIKLPLSVETFKVLEHPLSQIKSIEADMQSLVDRFQDGKISKEEVTKLYQDLIEQRKNEFARYESDSDVKKMLSYNVSFPRLFELRPELEDLEIRFINGDKGLRGKVDVDRFRLDSVDSQSIAINVDRSSMGGVVLHELQHVLQNLSGAPAGCSTPLFGDMSEEMRGELDYEDINKRVYGYMAREPLRPNIMNVLLNVLTELEKVELSIQARHAVNSDDAFDKYRNAYGEIEARSAALYLGGEHPIVRDCNDSDYDGLLLTGQSRFMLTALEMQKCTAGAINRLARDKKRTYSLG
ncbi:hypothetical protein AB4254_13685 [Vibrio breoganii]